MKRKILICSYSQTSVKQHLSQTPPLEALDMPKVMHTVAFMSIPNYLP